MLNSDLTSPFTTKKGSARVKSIHVWQLKHLYRYARFCILVGGGVKIHIVIDYSRDCLIVDDVKNEFFDLYCFTSASSSHLFRLLLGRCNEHSQRFRVRDLKFDQH